jgi:hypothetical protein
VLKVLSRHEEKYIIDYKQYAVLREMALQLLTPDPNGVNGSYVITSLYFDDFMDHSLAEKMDGLPEHSKFRIRTYDFTDRIIKLERKDKHGILTKKYAATIRKDQIPLLEGVSTQLDEFTGKAYDLAAQIQAGDYRKVVAVRYRRDAFFFRGTDLRLTFDTNLEVIRPEIQALFSSEVTGLPVLDGNSVIMEVKYGAYIPSFVRKFTSVGTKQLSVSKYALCRETFQY